MRALKQLWTPTSRLYDRTDEGQPRRFVLDCGIAWQNYRDDAGVFQEIDLTPELVPGGLRVRKVPYDLTLLTTGERRIAPDRVFAATRFIRFPANKFLANKTFIRVGNSLVWRSNAYDIILRWRGDRIKFDVVLKRPVPFNQVQLDVEKTGIDDTTFLGYLTNLKAIDSSVPEPIVRPLSVSLVAGVLTLGFDLTGMTFPVTIDPTLDISVGASADDTFARRQTTTNFSATATGLTVGNFSTSFYGYGYSTRYTGVNIPSGATIDVAYQTTVPHTSLSGTVVNSDLCAENASNPTAPTTYDDHIGRTRTAATAWDNMAAVTAGTPVQSPSITAPIQAVVDAQGGTGDALQIFHEDKDLESSTGAYRGMASWDSTTYDPPAIHIEYTAGGGRIMGALAGHGGLAGYGGIAGRRGGIAG